MAEVVYDMEQARRAVLSMQAKANELEERAEELRDLADEWSRQASHTQHKAVELAVRIAEDESRSEVQFDPEGLDKL